MTGRSIKGGVLGLVAVLVLVGCGGGESADDATEEVSAPSGAPATGDTVETGDTISAPVTDEPALQPGPVSVRVVNFLDESVDLHVRTDGIVRAELVQSGLAVGEVSEVHRPPQDGRLIVTVAGAGDAACVVDCDHILTEVSTRAEEGDARTLVLASVDGVISALELWERPGPDRTDSANAMVPADPSAGIVVVTGFGVRDAPFGMRMAIAGSAGCVEPFNVPGVLIGGNQTPAFMLPSSRVDVTIHDNTDRDCAAPIGGPFTVEAAPGSRTHLLLHDSLASVEGIVLPMLGDDVTGAGAGDESSTPSNGLVDQLALSVEVGLGLPADQAECVAGLFIEYIGLDVLTAPDGSLVDLDALPAEIVEGPATAALVASVDACGVDPSALG